MVCDDQGVTLEQLPVLKEYFRFSEDSSGIYSCAEFKYVKNCLGSGYWTNASATATSSSRRLDATGGGGGGGAAIEALTWGDATCLATAKGPLCSVCTDGSYFAEDQCVECGAYVMPPRVVIVICLLAILLSCVVAYAFFCNRLSQFAEEANENAKSGDFDIVAQAEDKLQDTIDKVESQVQEKLDEGRAQVEDTAESMMAEEHKAWIQSDKMKKWREKLNLLYIKLAPKLKIIITFSQLVSGFGFALAFRFPEPYTSFVGGLESLTDTVSLNLFSMAPTECYYYGTNYFTNLVFSTMYPIVLSVILTGLHARDQARKKEGSPWFSIFLALTYLILPSAAVKIFYSFKWDYFCEGEVNFEDGAIKNDGICNGKESFEGHRAFLAVDYGIEYGTAEADALIIYAIIMIFVYAIGVPTLYVVLLYRAQAELSLQIPIKLDPAKLVCDPKERAELKAALMQFYFGDVTLGHGVTDKTIEMLQEVADENDLKGETFLPLLQLYIKAQEETWEKVSHNHMLSFLIHSWEQRVYWWEVFEVIRRLMLSGVLVLFGPGSAIQSAMSILICLVSIKGYSLYAPFREDEDNLLQEVTQWQLFMVLFSAILARMDTSSDSASDQTFLGWLLIAFLVPGYVTMAWQCVKSYLDVFYEQAQPGFEAATNEPAKMDFLVEEGESVTAVETAAFSGGAEVASQSFYCFAGAFDTAEDEEGTIEVPEVSIVPEPSISTTTL